MHQVIAVPDLKIDAILYKDEPMHIRAKNERRVVFALLEMLVKNGFRISGVWDGETMEKTYSETSQITDAMELIFNLDESSVWVRKEGFKEHYIFIVLGNADDGSEVVADYSYSDGDPDNFNGLMEAFEPEKYV
jgi:hypothetical protein